MYNSNFFLCGTRSNKKMFQNDQNHVQPATKFLEMRLEMQEETQLPRPVCHVDACKDNTEHAHACVSIVGKHVLPYAEMLAHSSGCHEMPGTLNLCGDAGRDAIAPTSLHFIMLPQYSWKFVWKCRRRHNGPDPFATDKPAKTTLNTYMHV